MPERDALLRTVEAIHAAGLDAELWPRALASTAALLGSSAATVESYDLRSGQLLDFYSFGIPPAEQAAHRDHYAAINPRAAYAHKRSASELVWDYLVLDEAAMDRDPYYSEFLPRTDFRYFLSGNLFRTPRELAVATVQRTRAQGHVEASEIGLMRRLVPHLRQALDVATRLRSAAGAGRSLEGALDWLADGAALVAADGSVVHANDALQAILRRRDGLRIANGGFEFAASRTRARFAAALAAVVQLREPQAIDAGTSDLAVPRGAGALPYLLAVRPLVRTDAGGGPDARAVAVVFVRDPSSRNPAASQVLREAFGLTAAEASLARALQAGTSVAQYARERALSLNTIYTHLRRVQEKTRSKSMGELIDTLSHLQAPLRTFE